MQRNLHLYNYFTQDEWDSLGNSCNTLDTKLQVVSKRCGLIGLTAPAETTYVLAVSIIIMACHKGPARRFGHRCSENIWDAQRFEGWCLRMCAKELHTVGYKSIQNPPGT